MIFNKMKWAPFALTLFTIPLVSSCSSDDEEEQQEVLSIHICFQKDGCKITKKSPTVQENRPFFVNPILLRSPGHRTAF